MKVTVLFRSYFRAACVTAILLGLLVSPELAGRSLSSHSSLVYCPLQKQWVKRIEPQKFRPISGLPEICSDTKAKADFLEGLLISSISDIEIQDSDIADNLFFVYQTKGVRAFSEIPSAPDAPRIPSSEIASRKNGAIAARGELITGIVEIFLLEQLSWPPTRRSASEFPFPECANSEFVSYTINTRGPPHSFS